MLVWILDVTGRQILIKICQGHLDLEARKKSTKGGSGSGRGLQ